MCINAILKPNFFRLLTFLPDISMNKGFVEFTDCFITLNMCDHAAGK